MRHKYLIDAGHGGLAFGHYLTPGKRSPEIGEGVGIFEGEFNRDIAARLADYSEDIEALTPGPIRIPLTMRCDYINRIYKREPSLIVLSIHANAMDGGWTKHKGHRIFVAQQASQNSRDLAACLDSSFRENISEPTCSTIRKENFTMLARTRCPAVLVECGFMTNRDEAAYLASETGRYAIATTIINAVAEFDRGM